MAMLSPKKLRKLFNRHATGDNDADKCLDRTRFESFLRDYGYTPDDLKKCFDNLDADGSQTISWDECQNLLAKTDRSPDERQSEIAEALKFVMKNKKEDYVDMDLLRHILTVGPDGLPEEKADLMIENLYAQYDKNKDEKLSRKELSEILVGKKDKRKGKRKGKKRKDKHRDGRRRGSNSSDSSSSSGSSSDDEHGHHHDNDVTSEPLLQTTVDAPEPTRDDNVETETQLQNGTLDETPGDIGQTQETTENQGDAEQATQGEGQTTQGEDVQVGQAESGDQPQPEPKQETQPAEEPQGGETQEATGDDTGTAQETAE